MSLEHNERKQKWYQEPKEIPFIFLYSGCYYLFMGGTIVLFSTVSAGMSAARFINTLREKTKKTD